jgi:hypothetical protein
MLEECVDYLELATKSLAVKITQLEEEENAILFENSNTDSNSVDCENGHQVLTGTNHGKYQI